VTDASFLVHPFDSADLYTARLIVKMVQNPICSASVTRVIEVTDTLDVPNVFSPNEDNINDQWIVRSNGKTVYSLKIFARTGTLVYQAEARVITWDGRNQSGQEMAPDVYYYLLEPVSLKTIISRPRTGFIHLYR
jgi:gliding motility-associated-like protein